MRTYRDQHAPEKVIERWRVWSLSRSVCSPSCPAHALEKKGLEAGEDNFYQFQTHHAEDRVWMIHPKRLILKAQVHVPIEPLKTREEPLTRFSGKPDIFGVVFQSSGIR